MLAAAAVWSLAAAHTVITYPGWRGNNLHTSGDLPQHNASLLGMNWVPENDSYSFPYGMQWMYPCKPSPASQYTAAKLIRL